MRVFGLLLSIVSLGCVGIAMARQFTLSELERRRRPFILKAILWLPAPIVVWMAVFFFLEFLHSIRPGRW